MSEQASYLLTIKSVRERCNRIIPKIEQNQLVNYNVDLDKMDEVAQYVSSLIERDFAGKYDQIPPHGRWQHFEAGGVKRLEKLLAQWEGVDKREQTKRLLDLFTVGVLLDAGAGMAWKYRESDGTVSNRSEGLAVASLDMFKSGLFSSNPSQPYQVDAKALGELTADQLAKGLQVNETDNQMQGLSGRCSVLIRLGTALSNSDYFPTGRPGDMLDQFDKQVDIVQLWDFLMKGLGPIWPQGRTKLDGVGLGDSWPCQATDCIIPFHKLTQWLCYSLTVPMKKILGMEFINEDVQTGLPEYRNGGIFIDIPVLSLKDSVQETEPRINNIPTFAPDSDVIVEWRAATVVLLDMLLPKVNALLKVNEKENGSAKLTLPQLLEAGSWKAGRELSKSTDQILPTLQSKSCLTAPSFKK